MCFFVGFLAVKNASAVSPGTTCDTKKTKSTDKQYHSTGGGGGGGWAECGQGGGLVR